jgi:hypothetical protein
MEGKQRRDVGPAVTPDEARRRLVARREHSKGDGNLPPVEPGSQLLDERPEDRMPRDIPKERDDRSAPKGNATAGQEARNPDREVRDDFQIARRRTSGFTEAQRAGAEATAPVAPERTARPTARRSTAAKRDATRAERSRAAKPKRRAETTERKPAPSRGGVTARTAKKRKASATKDRRERASRRARS